jgi:hypothetical protein
LVRYVDLCRSFRRSKHGGFRGRLVGEFFYRYVLPKFWFGGQICQRTRTDVRTRKSRLKVQVQVDSLSHCRNKSQAADDSERSPLWLGPGRAKPRPAGRRAASRTHAALEATGSRLRARAAPPSMIMASRLAAVFRSSSWTLNLTALSPSLLCFPNFHPISWSRTHGRR